MHRSLADALRHAILEFSYAAAAAGGNGSGPSRAADKRRWGVVQPVGHLTVNEDGEGSNPSDPANFSLSIGSPRAQYSSLWGVKPCQWFAAGRRAMAAFGLC